MNLIEAQINVTSDNADLILMRVSGSVSVVRLEETLQGKLNWIERDEVMQKALSAAQAAVCPLDGSHR